MSPAICLNLDQSKILSFGNGLTPYHDENISNLAKLKEFSHCKVYLDKMIEFVPERCENSEGKEENIGYQHFLLFP